VGLLGLENSPESKSVQALRQNSKGSGVGQKISRELADRSGIEIELQPNPKGETIGIMRFPMAA